jgi:hypothetical protein
MCVKCKSAPIPLKQWALEELTKIEDRLREKGAVKDMESMFDDIKEEGTQTKLMGTDKDKGTAAKAVCGQGRCRLGVQHHVILQRDRRLQLHRDDPRPCCSVVIGGGGGREGGKGFVV